MTLHPLSDFRYCPHCGADGFAVHDSHSKRCAACGFTFFPNASAATVAVITRADGCLLCLRRRREPAADTLDLPGGFVDPGESLTDGLVREVMEETGGQVSACRFLFSLPNAYPFSGHVVHTADAFFRVSLATESGLRPADDAAELLWVPRAELEPALFGLDSVRHGVERLLADDLL